MSQTQFLNRLYKFNVLVHLSQNHIRYVINTLEIIVSFVVGIVCTLNIQHTKNKCTWQDLVAKNYTNKPVEWYEAKVYDSRKHRTDLRRIRKQHNWSTKNQDNSHSARHDLLKNAKEIPVWKPFLSKQKWVEASKLASSAIGRRRRANTGEFLFDTCQLRDWMASLK